MSERFMIDTAGTLIDMVTRNTYDYVSEVCPLLNDIDSENTHVKYSLSAHMVDLNNCKGKCSALEEENEQLKSKNRGLQSELQIFKEDATHSNLQINKLADENEQLKKQLKELQDFKDNYDKNMELIHNSDYVQDFLNGNL